MTKALTLKKSLGQHFLHDEAICREIISHINRTPGLQLLEIGPGGGALTKYLLQWEEVDYKAIEVDEEKVDYLIKHYPALQNRILHIDFLNAISPFNGDFSIIGNFPYNISSQILFRILEWEDQVFEMVGMFQKEVAQRVAAKEGSKTYGILSVLTQAYYKVEYLFDVPARSFSPPPKVVSGVIKLTRTDNPYRISNRKNFARLVKAGFNQRRKTLRNALKGTLSPEVLTAEIFSKRAEQLSVADFVTLYKTYLTEEK